MANIKCMVVLLMSLQMWIKPHDGAIVGVLLERHLEYKLLRMSKNVHDGDGG
jgi:hypothetical protein